jgi:hypothetical protein
LYVLRKTADVPDEATDTTCGEIATVYGNLCEARPEHATPQFPVDNAKKKTGK